MEMMKDGKVIISYEIVVNEQGIGAVEGIHPLLDMRMEMSEVDEEYKKLRDEIQEKMAKLTELVHNELDKEEE